MDTRNPNTRKRADERETLENMQTRLLEHEAARHRTLLGAWVVVTAVALVTTVALLESCGNEKAASVKSAADEQQATVAPQQNVVASTDGALATAGAPGAVRGSSAVAQDIVPPDAVVAVSDTFVTAGQPIEVTAQGTPDVKEMALSDGHGDALPMVKDSTGNTWRVHYRVPLRPRTDRLGLSVTAKNDPGRWRRVWFFLQVNDGKQQVESQLPDSSKSESR